MKGIERVLDILQEKGRIDALMLFQTVAQARL